MREFSLGTLRLTVAVFTEAGSCRQIAELACVCVSVCLCVCRHAAEVRAYTQLRTYIPIGTSSSRGSWMELSACDNAACEGFWSRSLPLLSLSLLNDTIPRSP